MLPQSKPPARLLVCPLASPTSWLFRTVTASCFMDPTATKHHVPTPSIQDSTFKHATAFCPSRACQSPKSTGDVTLTKLIRAKTSTCHWQHRASIQNAFIGKKRRRICEGIPSGSCKPQPSSGKRYVGLEEAITSNALDVAWMLFIAIEYRQYFLHSAHTTVNGHSCKSMSAHPKPRDVSFFLVSYCRCFRGFATRLASRLFP